ncbi:hypothetical protein MAFF241648_43750 (plasmid) [Ralstonia solanacearum]|nr:hypothetical protein MAFF241648_43750 [Ralstonia solanacearum]
MHDPSRRWANPAEFDYYAKGYNTKNLSKLLRRTSRTIRDWQRGARPIPSWTVDVLRLKDAEAVENRRRLYPLHERRQMQLLQDDQCSEPKNRSYSVTNGDGGP